MHTIDIFRTNGITHVSLEYDVSDIYDLITITPLSLIFKYLLSANKIPCINTSIKFSQDNSEVKCYLYIDFKSPSMLAELMLKKFYSIASKSNYEEYPIKTILENHIISNLSTLITRSITANNNPISRAYSYSEGISLLESFKDDKYTFIKKITLNAKQFTRVLAHQPSRQLVISDIPIETMTGKIFHSEKTQGKSLQDLKSLQFTQNLEIVSKTNRPSLYLSFKQNSLEIKTSDRICRHINSTIFTEFREKYMLYLLIAYFDKISQTIVVVIQSPLLNSADNNIKIINSLMDSIKKIHAEELVKNNLSPNRMPINSLIYKKINSFQNYRTNYSKQENKINPLDAKNIEFKLQGVGVVSNTQHTEYKAFFVD